MAAPNGRAFFRFATVARIVIASAREGPPINR
ncbi:MAG: hypothetical protein QOI34_118 [Verrucomicrobiota bacterium]